MTTALIAPEQAALERLIRLVVDSVTSAESKRSYRKALGDFVYWRGSSDPRPPFTKATVQAYRAALEARALSPSTINVRLAAIRKLATEAADNGLMAPELAAGIFRVKGAKQAGVRAGNWLTRDQAEALLNRPDPTTMKGKRDRALLAVLLGCGLRRKEAGGLSLGHVQQRDGRWAIVDLVGKGARMRTVPMPSWAKAAIDAWTQAAGISAGRIFRAINKGDRITGESMTAQAIFETVRHYAAEIGVEIAPHDLRRTFAKLAHKGQAALEQIQLSLGHASIQTTERYLGVRQDLTDAPCDRLGLRIEVTREEAFPKVETS